ncbi:MAG: LPS export ABC transporter periplasmic protein LptC [Pseudomonadota bacterium]
MNVNSETRENSVYPDSPAGLDFLSGQRSDHEYQNAVRHARRVRILKFAMPVIGMFIILAIVAALFVRQMFLPGIDLGAINIKDGKLVMENPSLNGVDKNKRPFQLSADRAIQDAEQPTRVELVKISATLPVDEKVSAEISAGNGIYDAEAKTLILSEQVYVETSDGMRIDLEDADVDIGNGTLITSNPVFASSPQADISADGMTVNESGEHFVFEGTIRMTLRPRELKKDGDANDQ